MGQHVRLAGDDVEDGAVGGDHERRALVGERADAPHAVPPGDGTVRIRQQRKAQPVGLIELSLPVNLIGADSHSLGTELGELGGQIAEVAALLGSPGCHGLRIEEQHDGTGLDQVGQRDQRTGLIGRLELGSLITDLHFSTSLALLDAGPLVA